MEEEILVNKLFSGSYLYEGTNIGHEVINLFKADDGKNYLYITPSGDIGNHQVKSIIFVRHIEGKTTVEVIAKAERLEKTTIPADEIKYAGTTLDKIFQKNTFHGDSDPSPHYTLKTDKIRMPKYGRRIQLTIDEEYAPEDDSIQLIRLHSYYKAISPEIGRKYFSLQTDPEAYRELKNLIEDEENWEQSDTTEKLFADGKTHTESPTFLEIIRKDNDELVFSNLLAHYFQYDGAVFQRFAKQVLGIDFDAHFNIIRESNGNIDLWIEDSKHVLVIENKIKSGLNGRKDGKEDKYTQLNKYQEFTKNQISNPKESAFGKEDFYYIFTPDYNHIDTSQCNLEKPYKLITYSEIYKFFCNNAVEFMDDKYFADFIKGLKAHSMSMSELSHSIMRSRFLEVINRK